MVGDGRRRYRGGRGVIRFHVPAATAEAQRSAADPTCSAWVSANAGAGKTKVLSDRVLRLLLEGSPPGRILCLTFTKAAAANMAIRVFDRLGRWVTLDDATLARELLELEGRGPDAKRLAKARRLFAKAVETPGGLKIDTIHAFCERLLHMAPFEANVPARFAVLDDGQAAELLAEATANTFADASLGGDPALFDALARVAEEVAGEQLGAVLKAALMRRDVFTRSGGVDAFLGALRSRLGLREGDDEDGALRAILDEGIPPAELAEIAIVLQATGKATDARLAECAREAASHSDRRVRLAAYLEIFFTDTGPRKSVGTKGIPEPVCTRLADEQARLIEPLERFRSASAFEKTRALFRLAAEIRERIEAQKRRLGALDFQDMIDKTRALLDGGYGPWVLYKLDRGVDHVLIDEAQDTNPEQWDILRRITEDFTAGAGSSEAKARTVFAVGDPKQSIYGFQGADPRRFEDSRTRWRRTVEGAGLTFADVRLTLSFRSVSAVLRAVDATFAVEDHLKGISFEVPAVTPVHETARPGAPGRIELWPVARPTASEDADAWTLPVDQPDSAAPPVRVARRIARTIRRWTRQGDESGRLWRPGEVLILVRKRGPAFEAMIRALKDLGVPVAGADRIDISKHIAIEDLVAAGAAALRREDDLTLAAALKSPLGGFDDEDLVAVATHRAEGESLAAALVRHAAAGLPCAERACRLLEDWRALAAAHGPFGFFATLLGPRGGRRALVSRLGAEAGDAIDAFLCAAHEAEGRETPSLSTFLAKFATADHEIKRDLESGRDEVRVMTVHGAKGLEAELVFLLDGCNLGARTPPLLSLSEDGTPSLPLWCSAKAMDPGPARTARDTAKARELEEHNRLLYVAMTRAKDRLVVAPYATNTHKLPTEVWSEMIRRGLGLEAGSPLGPARSEDTEDGAVDFWCDGDEAVPTPSETPPPDLAPALPDWLHRPLAAEPEPAPPLRPSGALAAADRPARPGEGRFSAPHRLRGVIVHALLERLPDVPEERREEAAHGFIEARAPALPAALRSAMARDALAVLRDPRLAALFGPGSRAEAPIAGRVLLPGESGARAVSGQIDRLLIGPDQVIFADFKTTARPPLPDAATPRAYLAQAALYRALLRRIVPDKPVRGFLIWTSGVVVREFGEAELDAALAAIIPA
jgi:ATP-dependent helicase/nuclease subunit A